LDIDGKGFWTNFRFLVGKIVIESYLGNECRYSHAFFFIL
jgi:hypothetical protein